MEILKGVFAWAAIVGFVACCTWALSRATSWKLARQRRANEAALADPWRPLR